MFTFILGKQCKNSLQIFGQCSRKCFWAPEVSKKGRRQLYRPGRASQGKCLVMSLCCRLLDNKHHPIKAHNESALQTCSLCLKGTTCSFSKGVKHIGIGTENLQFASSVQKYQHLIYLKGPMNAYCIIYSCSLFKATVRSRAEACEGGFSLGSQGLGHDFTGMPWTCCVSGHERERALILGKYWWYI